MSEEIELTITSQLGGPDAASVARPSIRRLARLLSDLNNLGDIISLDEIRLRTRVGGLIENSKEITGVYNAKVLKRYKYATAEIIVNRKDLTDGEGFHILYTKLLGQALDDLKILLEKKDVLLDADKYDSSIKNAILRGMSDQHTV